MLLLIDNYDSFVFNLARYLRRLGQETRVVRNDAITADQVAEVQPDAIVISPGPGTPQQAGCSLEIVRQSAPTLPILGICLGHQAIAEALGARIVRASEPVHGRTSRVFHDEAGIFAGLQSPLIAGRYHSLVVDRLDLPACLSVTAWTEDGTIMAIEHRQRPLVGLQFHPESILTEAGFELLGGFLRRVGVALPERLPNLDSELMTQSDVAYREAGM